MCLRRAGSAGSCSAPCWEFMHAATWAVIRGRPCAAAWVDLRGWRFVRGRGPVPRVNSLLPDTAFANVEQRGALPTEVDASLERYYVTKLSSLQFCGPPNFDLPFWTGLDSLILTLPMIQWLARRCRRRSGAGGPQGDAAGRPSLRQQPHPRLTPHSLFLATAERGSGEAHCLVQPLMR